MTRTISTLTLMALIAITAMGCATTMENPRMAAGELEAEQMNQDRDCAENAAAEARAEYRELLERYEAMRREL